MTTCRVGRCINVCVYVCIHSLRPFRPATKRDSSTLVNAAIKLSEVNPQVVSATNCSLSWTGLGLQAKTHCKSSTRRHWRSTFKAERGREAEGFRTKKLPEKMSKSHGVLVQPSTNIYLYTKRLTLANTRHTWRERRKHREKKVLSLFSSLVATYPWFIDWERGLSFKWFFNCNNSRWQMEMLQAVTRAGLSLVEYSCNRQENSARTETPCRNIQGSVCSGSFVGIDFGGLATVRGRLTCRFWPCEASQLLHQHIFLFLFNLSAT